MLKGLLIVPGAHASLDNISPSGLWLEDEVFTYNGQERRHVKGMTAGRALLAWRKLRDEQPSLFRHFSVMSQPASNADGITLPWTIKSQSMSYPVSIWMRDAYGLAFSEHTMRTLFMGHQLQSR